jgi:hypothetical protein
MIPSLTSGNLRTLLLIEARMRVPRPPTSISREESAVLASVAARTCPESGSPVIQELLRIGLLYDDKGEAGLILTERGRESLRANPPDPA